MNKTSVRRNGSGEIAFRSLLIFFLVTCSSCAKSRPTPQIPPGESETKVRELLRLGTQSLRDGSNESLQQSQAFFELALELRQGDPRALDGLGSVAFRAGNLARAQWYFRKAATADERYDRAYEHLAAVAQQRDEAAQAIALLELAVRLNPLNFRARNNLAMLLRGHVAPRDDDRDRSILRSRAELRKADAILRKPPELIDENQVLMRRNYEAIVGQENCDEVSGSKRVEAPHDLHH